MTAGDLSPAPRVSPTPMLGEVPRPRRGGLFSKPAALRVELERAFPERPFAIRFWDGSEVAATAPGPTFLVNSPAAIAHLVRAPGELGLARAYVQGLLDVDDIDGAIGVVEHWRPPKLEALIKEGPGLPKTRCVP